MTKQRRLPVEINLALGFMCMILVGAVLLYLPISHQEGQSMSFLDSLFLSTSGVCVTGLTPVDISKTLSVFGSTVLMVLFQLLMGLLSGIFGLFPEIEPLRQEAQMEISGGRMDVSDVDVMEYVGWKDRIIITGGQTLDQIMQKLARYYGADISVSDEVAGMMMNGKLDLQEDLSSVLDNLCILLPLEYERCKGDRYIISFRK